MTTLPSLSAAPCAPGFPSAFEWVEQILLGPLGTALAVIAVAWFGFETLNGHLSFRRGASLILGCFILFGAPKIAYELMALMRSSGSANPGAIQQAPPSAPPPPSKPKSPPPFDPYAGASVPNARN